MTSKVDSEDKIYGYCDEASSRQLNIDRFFAPLSRASGLGKLTVTSQSGGKLFVERIRQKVLHVVSGVSEASQQLS